MKKIAVSWLIVILAPILIFSGCRKAKLNRQTTTEVDYTIVDNVFSDVQNIVQKSVLQQPSLLRTQDVVEVTNDSCASITFSSSDSIFPITMTINFGNLNCKGLDGKYRRGKIICELSGRYFETGSVITTTFDNYYVNDYKVEATHVAENMGNFTFNIKVTNGKITYPSNETVTWESTRTRKQIEGSNTQFSIFPSDTNCFLNISCIFDDAYEITGTALGVNSEGRLFDAKITSPMHLQFCDYVPEITQGIIEVQPEDLLKRTIDFGNKNCDKEAKVTIGKKEYFINLK